MAKTKIVRVKVVSTVTANGNIRVTTKTSNGYSTRTSTKYFRGR